MDKLITIAVVLLQLTECWRLPNKLECYDLCLNFFESYLANQKQYLTINRIIGNSKIAKCGISQEIIFEPILFVLNLYRELRETCSGLSTGLQKHVIEWINLMQTLNILKKLEKQNRAAWTHFWLPELRTSYRARGWCLVRSWPAWVWLDYNYYCTRKQLAKCKT